MSSISDFLVSGEEVFCIKARGLTCCRFCGIGKVKPLPIFCCMSQSVAEEGGLLELGLFPTRVRDLEVASVLTEPFFG